jgi:hypothetical protein
VSVCVQDRVHLAGHFTAAKTFAEKEDAKIRRRCMWWEVDTMAGLSLLCVSRSLLCVGRSLLCDSKSLLCDSRSRRRILWRAYVKWDSQHRQEAPRVEAASPHVACLRDGYYGGLMSNIFFWFVANFGKIEPTGMHFPVQVRQPRPCRSSAALSKDWTVPDGVLQYHHTMRVSSRTRRLRNISSVGTRMYVCVYVCRYALRRHDRHRGRAK